jgi:hypothetical protein
VFCFGGVTGTGTMVTDGFSFRISLVSGYEPWGCSLVMQEVCFDT